jgi:signal transduction histidine kinase
MDLLELTIRPVDLPEIVAAVLEDAEDHAQANGVKLVTSFPPVLPEIQADADGLMRTFHALLDNAIKFSPDGGEVRIEVGVTSDHTNVAFIDPGIGIEPEFLPRIFDRFERREQYGDTLFSGMGLGLSIAKHLIESIGGHISVQSEVGRGSVFTVHLPVLNAAKSTDPTADGA